MSVVGQVQILIHSGFRHHELIFRDLPSNMVLIGDNSWVWKYYFLNNKCFNANSGVTFIKVSGYTLRGINSTNFFFLTKWGLTLNEKNLLTLE